MAGLSAGRRRLLIVIAGVVLVGAAAYSGWRYIDTPGEADAPPAEGDGGEASPEALRRSIEEQRAELERLKREQAQARAEKQRLEQRIESTESAAAEARAELDELRRQGGDR